MIKFEEYFLEARAGAFQGTDSEGRLPAKSSDPVMEGFENSPRKQLLRVVGTSLLLNDGLGSLSPENYRQGLLGRYLPVNFLLPLPGLPLLELLHVYDSATALLGHFLCLARPPRLLSSMPAGRRPR